MSTTNNEYIKAGTFKSDDGAYGIDLNGTTVKLKAHNWKYRVANKDTIMAECADCGADGGSVTLTAPAANTLTYNGKAKQAKLTANDWLGADVKKIEITYRKCSDNICRLIDTDPTDAGKYTASIKLGEATASVGYTIKKAKLTVTAKDTTITYGNELMGSGVKYTGLVSGDKLGGTLDYDYTYTRYGDINGSYTISPKGLTSNNYEITPASGKLTVLPREVTLTWKNTENRTVGDGKGPVTAEVGNLVNGDEIGVTILNGTLPNAAGRSTVTATDLTGEKADNYKLPAENTKEYEIGKAAATVTTRPEANTGLTYTGEAQALVTGGEVNGGTLVYSTTENGTYTVTIPTGTDAHTYKVWYKVEGDGTHSSTAPVELEVTIAPKALTAADITVAKIASTTYTGKDITPTVTVKDGNKTLENGTDYDVAYTDNRNAGTATVTVTGKGNYIDTASTKWTITPALLTVQSATVNSKTYNGTKNADVSEVNFGGLVSGETLGINTDYEVKAEFDSADAADSRTATVTVTLKGTTAAKNYTLTKTGCEGSAAIRKASQTVTIPSGKSITKNGIGVDISTWASAAGVPGDSDLGKLTYSLTGGAYSGVTLEGTVLTVQKETTAGSIIIKVQAAATKNYEASEEKTFTVTVTDKETVTISGLTYANKTYDGKAIAPAGTLTVEGGKVPATELEVLYESTDGKGYSKTEAPKDAGAYKVTYKVADSNERYIGSVTYDFIISPKAVTAAPANKTMTKGSAIPAFELTYKGLVTGDTLTPSVAPTFSCYEKDTTPVTTNTAAGTYTITWTNMEGTTFDNGNYAVTTSATGTLTISNRSTGGGGGGGGASAPTYPVSSSNASASAAVGGSVSASTKNAAAGSTVTVTVSPEAGYRLEKLTVVDKNGKEIPVTLKDGKYTFTMPASQVDIKPVFEKIPAETAETAFPDVPSSAYYAEPVKWAAEKGITSGTKDGGFAPGNTCTRAQIVTFLWRAAGSPEPQTTQTGMTDVSPAAYYAKAVAWAIENGITVGRSDGSFNPNGTCTRANGVTFLYRAAKAAASGNDAGFSDVTADAYYAAAVQWALENGITNGQSNGLFGPNGACTRAQIVTFLYRLYVKA